MIIDERGTCASQQLGGQVVLIERLWVVQCQKKVGAIVDQAQRMGSPGEGIWSCRLLEPLVKRKPVPEAVS